MLFEQILKPLPKASESLLTDGQLTCSWPEIIDTLTNIQAFLTEKGVITQDHIALECENSIPSLIALLTLLKEGYSVLLLPKENKPESELTIPQFCRYRITPNTPEKIEKNYLAQPHYFLSITDNPNWGSRTLTNSEPKLYLRTSGSTGTPKIAVHSHRKLLGNALNCVERLALNPDDRVAIPVPIYHMYGLGAGLLPSVVVRASIDLQKGANLLRYLQREREFDPNVAFMTPSFCKTLLKGRKSARPYKVTVVAGDRLQEDTLIDYENLFGCVVRLYGTTEMGAIAAASPEDSREIRSQGVGLPMAGVKLHLEESTAELSEEMQGVGELRCQHQYGFDGYIDPEGNPINPLGEEENQWFYTKDLARIHKSGYLEVLGRCDHSINRDGLLVLFSDVEKALEALTGIEAVVVVSQGEQTRGKGLIAYCVLGKDNQLSEADIRSKCFGLLPKRAIPDRVIILKALPMLNNGKIDRQALLKTQID